MTHRFATVGPSTFPLRLVGPTRPWLAAQHDPASDVSANAKMAFEAVFATEEKRDRVLGLCSSAITEHCRDLIMSQTVDTLADLQGVSLDQHEKQELFERAFSAAVLMLAAAMAHLPNSTDETAIEMVQGIISAAKVSVLSILLSRLLHSLLYKAATQLRC